MQPQSLSAESWTQLAQDPLGSSGIRLNGRPTIASQQVTLLLQIAAGDLYFQPKGEKVVADLETGVVAKNAEGATNVRQQPLEVTLNDPSKDQTGGADYVRDDVAAGCRDDGRSCHRAETG